MEQINQRKYLALAVPFALSTWTQPLLGAVDTAVVGRLDSPVFIGGVAIGRLLEDTCGICRTTIEGGRLIELRASAPLGVCPSCKRLLVIE